MALLPSVDDLRRRAPVAVSLMALCALAACGKCSPEDPAAPADSSFGVKLGIKLPIASVMEGINPDKKPPYSGKKGTLRGTIRIDGDPPPETGLQFPERCKAATDAAYGKIFRVGNDHALADALVAVTNYGDRGFVPAESDAIQATIKDCVPDRLTYAVTFGQRIDLRNLDSKATYQPYLDGAKLRPVLLAVPKGPAINLYPEGPSPAHYMLRDNIGSGLVANVFLLNYATHDVTGLDGKYEIKNIPVGKVRVDVMLAVIGKSEGKELDIAEGDNTFDLTLHFDASKDLPKRRTPPPPASGSAAAGAAPSPAPSSSSAPAKP